MAEEPTQKSNEFPPQSAFFGFAERRVTPRGRIRIHFRWGRIAAALVGLIAFLWIGKSIALFFFFRDYRGFEEVTFTDMFLYPVTRTEVRTKFGNYHIEEAQRLIEEGEISEAFLLARNGLARSPENIDGRMLVARFFAASQPNIAIDLLEEGLPWSSERFEYVEFLVKLLLATKNDDRMREIAARFLPEQPEINRTNRVVALAAAQANFFRGSFDAAEDLIRDYQLMRTLEGNLLQVQISWNRGQKENAINRLKAFIRNNASQQLDSAYALLTRYLRESGNLSEALRFAISRSTQSPFNAAPRIDIVYIYEERGNEAQLKREVDSILEDFRNEEDAIRLLANFATDTGNTALARRIYELALENDFSMARFGLLFIETHVVGKDYEGAIAYCNELLAENPSWLQNYDSIFNSLRSIAYFAINNEELGQLYLSKFLNAENLRSETLVSVSRRFREIELYRQAREVLERAFSIDESNQSALSGIIEIDLIVGNSLNLAQNLQKLLRLRRPDYDLLARAYDELNSDRFIFTPNREDLLLDLDAVLGERVAAAN